MIATDSVEETEAPKPVLGAAPKTDGLSALNIEIGRSGFTDLFDQQMINTVRKRGEDSTSTVDHFAGALRSIGQSGYLDRASLHQADA